MGIFNFGKKHRDIVTNFKTVSVDNIYLISIPDDWYPYESDRFRTSTKDQKINFSATNYSKEVAQSDEYSNEYLESQFLPLFEKFVNEGGYVSNNDLEIRDNFIYQSFIVDDESQYYYYTSRLINNNLRVIIAFILRQEGSYKKEYADIIKKIGGSITHRIA